VVGGGSLAIAYRNCRDPVSWRATRKLGANHLIVRDDLKRPLEIWPRLAFGFPDSEALEGRYVRKEVGPGKPVESSNLSLEPAIELAAGQSVFWLPLSDQVFPSFLIDSNTKVDVCISGGSCAVGTVGALYCDKKSPGCVAAVILSDDDRRKLTIDGKTKIVLSVLATKETK